MKNTLSNSRFLFISAIVIAAALLRLLPHAPNFTPVTALALFAGASYNDKKLSLLFPILTMFVSDIFIGFHNTMLAVYVSLALTVVIGWYIKNKRTLPVIIGSTLASSLLFFFVTNLAVWIFQETMYPKTFQGLMECYTAAIPFFRNSLMGDIFYSSLFFGIIILAERSIPALAIKNK